MEAETVSSTGPLRQTIRSYIAYLLKSCFGGRHEVAIPSGGARRYRLRNISLHRLLKAFQDGPTCPPTTSLEGQ